MKKLYGRVEETSELVDKSYWIDKAKELGQEITLELYLPEPPGSAWFVCQSHSETVLNSIDTCGKHCGGYSPRNGKSGCCSGGVMDGFVSPKSNTS